MHSEQADAGRMETRRSALRAAIGAMLICTAVALAEDDSVVLLHGSAPAPIEADHFASRVDTFVWRNWESAELERMAEVLGTTAENVDTLGRSMGLPPHRPIGERKHKRGYVSVIRRNWHLLPYDQMMQLLGWDAVRLSRVLKEEDFLWFKLGMLKPRCEPLRYAPPTPEQEARAAEIKRIVEEHFGGGALTAPMEPRFAFIDYLSEPSPDIEVPPRREDEPIRFLYSYFALYGDPLSDPTLDPYPDGILQRLAAAGVNGVWMHVILRELAPCSQFPEFGEGYEKRLANLQRLVDRAAVYGIKIYLYVNEPRSMPDSWFEDHPELAGHRDEVQGHTAMCSSVPIVRDFMHESLAYIFREVKGLGGVFNITMVENLTNCYSRAHGQAPKCPRCSKRSPQEVIAEVNRTIAEGVHAGDPDARVLIWDWVWEHDWSEDIIAALPKNTYLMSVSEWDLPIMRGGVETVSGEYSLSSVGPGERALRNWGIARRHGVKTIAKVQVNCSWELSVVPYLPVMDLVAEHLDNLSRTGVDGLMLSWTLGGYPSPNLQLVKHFGQSPPPDPEKLLMQMANERFGERASLHARAAWRTFSEAFREYPFHIVQLYNSPVQLGPANLLFPKPTGYQATMVGFPYDDLTHWRAVYPAEVLAGQFDKLSMVWEQGLGLMRVAAEEADSPTHRQHAEEDRRIAEAAWTHFQSVANQTRFTVSRNAILNDALSEEQAAAHKQTMREAARAEIALAIRLFELTRADSRIGFEATNHYNYYPLDLVEKVVNCDYILNDWLPGLNAAPPEGDDTP